MINFCIDASLPDRMKNTKKLREIPDKGFNDNFFFIDEVF
jgi:hypothetical protein